MQPRNSNARGVYGGSNEKQHRHLHGKEDYQAARPNHKDSRRVLELVLDAKAVAFGVLEGAGSKDRTVSIFDSNGRLVSLERNGSLKKVQAF